MSTRNETFNGLRVFDVVGHYFELLSTVNPVDVTFFNEKGNVLGAEVQVSTGFNLDRRGLPPYTRIEITTGANEAVKFYHSDGTGGNKSNQADIIDKAGRLVGIVYGALGQLAQALIAGVNSLWVTLRPVPYGASLNSSTSLGNNGTEQVFSAASNVNGATLHRAAFISQNASGPVYISLHAHTVAPAAATDGAVVAFDDVKCQIGANYFGQGKVEMPVHIPAGKGLFFYNQSGVAETTARRSVLYTLH